MTAAGGATVVIGMGNVLLGDDGVGVRAVEALRTEALLDPTALPTGTRLVDGGTLGLNLLGAIEGARSLLLLDAVDLEQPAGRVSVLRGDEIEAAGGRWGRSVPAGVGELLAVARLMGCLPDQVALVGIQVDQVALGIGLSARVEAALPSAVAMARRELRELDGLACAARPHDGVGGAEGATA